MTGTSAQAQTGTAQQELTLYTSTIGAQFINTADDRVRGASNNPFDATTNSLKPKTTEVGNGPFPGDVAVYAFNLFGAPTLKKKLGTASYTCYFNYNKHALCVAYYNLTGGKGSVVASGPVDFNASGFHLVVTGGTEKYLGVSGGLTATPAARNTQRVDIAVEPTSSSGSGGNGKRVTTYASPSTAQFMNHADDRLRGMSTNPFAVKANALVIVTQGKEKGNGPFPGDDILYTFKLHKDAKLTKKAGSVVFTCYYNFVKRATCDAYLEFDDGVVLASGPVTFNSKSFKLSVTGGTQRYAGVSGEVTATPAAGNAERLQLQLRGLNA